MFEVYLDEAGYTGGDLLNRDQPVYALGAVSLPIETAREIVGKCFPETKAKELKHSVLSSRSRGREQIIDLISALSEQAGCTKAFVVHKEYVLLGRLVDHWVEPALRADGIKLYERGGNIGFLNITYGALGALLGSEGRRELLRRFQVMVRDRTVFAYESFWDSVSEVIREHPDFEDLLGMYEASNIRLGGIRHLWGLPKHLLDIGDIALLDIVTRFRAETSEPILLIHDRSSTLTKHRELWEATLSASAPPLLVGQDRRVIRFPIDAQIELADSASHLQLQLADIVAGATMAMWTAKAGAVFKNPAYVEALRQSPLPGHLIGGLWPTMEITPEQLETEGPVHQDAAEFISGLVSRARETDPERS